MAHPFLPTFITSHVAFSFSKKIKTIRKELSQIPSLFPPASGGPPFLLPQFPTQLQCYLLSDAFQHSSRQNWLVHLLWQPFFSSLHGTELSNISVCLYIPSNQYRIWYAIDMTSSSCPSQKLGIRPKGSHSSLFHASNSS